MMKILLIGDDITRTGGAERVIANVANAFSELGHEVEILSIHHSNTTLPYPLAPSIKIRSTYNHSDKSKLLFKCMILYYKLKFLISTHAIHKTQKILRLIPNIQSNKGSYDIILDNTWDSYHLFYKNKHTLYIKLVHISIEFCGIINNPRYAGKPEDFDTLVVLSTKELPLWQRHHKNVRVIPNFLPQIPAKSTDYSQKVVLSVGRMDNGDQKGFLRLIEIWKMVQESFNRYCDETNSSLRASKTSAAIHENEATKTMDCHDSASAESRNDTKPCHTEHSEVSQNARDISLSMKAQYDKTYPCHTDPEQSEGEVSHNRDISPMAQYNKKDLHEWQLVIVGDGILKSEIEAKIKALNLQDSIILKPFTKDIEKEYLSASIYAMSSHFEGFPMVLLESMSYGLAPISFDIKTGPSDIIDNEKSGFLIKDDDLQAYADKLMLLMSDEDLRTKFGKKSKELVSEKFSKEAVLRLWARLFENMKGIKL